MNGGDKAKVAKAGKSRRLEPDLVAAKKRDHEIKVAKFLAGGK